MGVRETDHAVRKELAATCDAPRIAICGKPAAPTSRASGCKPNRSMNAVVDRTKGSGVPLT